MWSGWEKSSEIALFCIYTNRVKGLTSLRKNTTVKMNKTQDYDTVYKSTHTVWFINLWAQIMNPHGPVKNERTDLHMDLFFFLS